MNGKGKEYDDEALTLCAFALKEVRDSDKSIIDIAYNYGFSSHEAFTRAFKTMYGVAPSTYWKRLVPVVLRKKLTRLTAVFSD